MKKADRKPCVDLPPSELDLILSCAHTKRCLLNAGVTTLAQLMSLSHSDLLQIRGIGKVIAGDIVKAREQYAKQTSAKSIAPPDNEMKGITKS